MAKRKKGGKKKGHRKNPKRVAAGKKAWRNNPRPFGKKKGHGKRKGKGRGKTYRPKKKGSKRGKTYHRPMTVSTKRPKVISKETVAKAYRTVIDRGGSPEHAARVRDRLERLRLHQVKASNVAHNAAMQAAEEKKRAEEFAAVFRKIGKEEARRAAL